jgi:hypothetical protein
VAAPPRRWLEAAAIAVLAAVLLLALQALAARLTAAHLAGEAAREFALLRSGQPLWQWRFHRPADLVAGRAFGAARVEAAPSGLRITGLDGSPFELGLPLARPVDLAHWPLLALELESPADGMLGVVWRGADGAACMAAAAMPLRDSQRRLRIDLRGLHWQAMAPGGCAAPAGATMLRLRIAVPAQRAIVLRAAALQAVAPAPLPDPADAHELPPRTAPSVVAAERLGLAAAAPVLRLPPGATAERQLDWRDAVQAVRPAALLLPADLPFPPAASAEPAAWPGWALALAYAAGLLLLARREPSGRGGRWLEIGALAFGPLWLIAGLQWGPRPGMPAMLGFVLALLYAAWAERRAPRRDWCWTGEWRAWLPPLALLPAVLLLWRLYGHPFAPPRPAHVAAYLAWAALQQWLVLVVVQRRLERLLPRAGLAVLGAALLFALLHTPNGRLMQLCLLAELWWGWCFLRRRRLLPVALAHALCALLAEAGLAGGLLRSLEVSARFFL